MDGVVGVTSGTSQPAPDRAVPTRVGRSGEVLALVRDRQPVTISELAAVMGVVRSTIAERLDRLACCDLVAAVDMPARGRGRPASGYRFNPDAGRILTAHVGMTGVRFGVADLAGDVLTHELVDLELASGPGAVGSVIASGCRRLMSRQPSAGPIFGIGVGLPGPVELRSDHLAGSGWDDHSLPALLTEEFDVPVYVDQDVNLLALGEHSTRGATPGPLLCVKVGSVIGCGIVVDGTLIVGTDGLAGEIGHTRISGSTERCACGNTGCLSASAGGAALAARLAADGYPTSHARDVVRLVHDGVPAAIGAVREAGRQLGTVLAGTVNLLNPHTIALWGYLAGAEDVLLAGVRDALYREANPAATFRLQLVTSELGDVTGLRGAALMVAQRVLSPDAVDRRLAS